jgi:transcriptional regulator with XRE-family HTH domain
VQQAVEVDVRRIGERIRERRIEAGLSQRELATDGVSNAYISRIEAGLRVPSLQAVIALARRLDTSAERLVFGARPPHECVFCGEPHTRRRRMMF